MHSIWRFRVIFVDVRISGNDCHTNCHYATVVRILAYSSQCLDDAWERIPLPRINIVLSSRTRDLWMRCPVLCECFYSVRSNPLARAFVWCNRLLILLGTRSPAHDYISIINEWSPENFLKLVISLYIIIIWYIQLVVII